MEFIFVISSLILMTVLPLIQFYKNDYILGFRNTSDALSAATWLSVFIFFDFILLKALPLVTKCAFMAFILTELSPKLALKHDFN